MLPSSCVRNLGRLGFSTVHLRRTAAAVASLTALLSTGALQLGDAGCGHDEGHEALSHEHALSHEGAHEDRNDPATLLSSGVGDPAGRQSHDDDCPPFCGDCDDCAGCFHPIATAVPPLVLAPLPSAFVGPAHVLLLPGAPPRWAPSPPLHVPRAGA